VIDYADPAHGQKDVGINIPEVAGNIRNNVTLGEYDVVISNAPARDNLQESQFAEAIELRNAGVQIPDDVVIENSHLSNKAQIAERVRQLMGMGEPTPQQVEMQNFERDITMKRMVLELEELKAKADSLEARAKLDSAKAGLEQPRFETETQLSMEQMKTDIAKLMAELQTKLEMAQLHSQAGITETIHSDTTKRITEELKLQQAAQLPAPKS